MNILVSFASPKETFELPKTYADRIDYIVTGIGKVAASSSLMKELHRVQPDLVLNIGTSGTLSLEVGDIVASTHIVDRDYMQNKGLELECELLDTYGKPLPLPSIIQGKETNNQMIISTGDNFVTEKQQAHGDVVDMEAFAMAWVCRMQKIPFISIKFVTDVIGDNSIDIWEDRLASARKGLAEYFERYQITDI